MGAGAEPRRDDLAMDRGKPSFVARQMSRAYALMIWAYPASFRRRFGREMHLAFRNEAGRTLEVSGELALTRLFLRLVGDWIVTLCKEYAEMPKLLIAPSIVLALAFVDWLAFHDLFEPHTFRDYLTLAASLLVVAYLMLRCCAFGIVYV